MPKGSTEHINWRQVAWELDTLAHGARAQYVDDIASQLNISVATVYRRLKSLDLKKTKTTRSGRDSKYSADLVLQALQIQEEYKTILLRGSSRALSTAQIIELMEEQGLVEPGEWSVSGLNAAFRKTGYRKQKPRVRVEAERYCQLFQIDFSRSKHFQVHRITEDGEWILRVSAKELHYKEGENRIRLWVTQMVDEFSRLRVIRYNAATGESPLLGISFLEWYFNRPDDGHFMRHVPDAIRGDQGSFMKSAEAMNALDALEIEHQMAPPGNKETQGKVERGFRSLWSVYESRLAYQLIREQGDRAEITLGDLNEWINLAMIEEQYKVHPTRTAIRLNMAQQSALRERPREVEADIRSIAFRTWERKADITCMVSVDGEELEVPDYCAGKTVRIHRNLHGEYVGQMVDGYTKAPFKVLPYEYAKLGSFEKKRSKVYSEIVRDKVLEQKKLRALTPQTEKVKPKTVFSEAEETPSNRRLHKPLRLIQAKQVFANELSFMGIIEDAEEWIPKMVVWAVEKKELYDGITKSQVRDLAIRIANAVDKRSRAAG